MTHTIQKAYQPTKIGLSLGLIISMLLATGCGSASTRATQIIEKPREESHITEESIDEESNDAESLEAQTIENEGEQAEPEPSEAPPESSNEPNTGQVYTCRYENDPFCDEYHLGESLSLEDAQGTCRMRNPSNSDEEDQPSPFTEGVCSLENAIARCEDPIGTHTIYYRESENSYYSEESILRMHESDCPGNFVRLDPQESE